MSALAAIDWAFDHQSWHGTNLRGSLRGLTLDEVTARPRPGRHNIWELVVHCAYWKYVVRRRLTGEKRGSFPLKGSNFFERPVPGAPRAALTRLWRADLTLLDEMHSQLRAVVGSLPGASLDDPGSAQRPTPLWLVQGIVSHDLYHAGQIQLLKRLVAD